MAAPPCCVGGGFGIERRGRFRWTSGAVQRRSASVASVGCLWRRGLAGNGQVRVSERYSLSAELDNESVVLALSFRCLDACVANPKYCRCLTVFSKIMERSERLYGLAHNRLWKSDKKALRNFVKSVQGVFTG